MNVAMRCELAAAYKSPAQQTKAVTEAWVAEQMYCPSCDATSLADTPANTKVVDFVCRSCDEEFQLKGKRRPFGNRVTDAAYDPMIERIVKGESPNFLFLHYDAPRCRVQNLFMIPRYFITASAVEKRPPLKAADRRHGWVGCNIHLGALPPDARIMVVQNEIVSPTTVVREAWRRFSFMDEEDAGSRGWLSDVLACVRRIGKETFTLAEMYAFEGALSKLHRENRNVRPKVRQQLQVLRDRGAVEFLGRGRYRVLAGQMKA